MDSAGAAYVTGGTRSPDFPTTPGAFDRSLNNDLGNSDAFVTKLAPSGSALAYSTYLGGNRFDVGNGIAVDSAGTAFVIGDASSDDFPTVNPIQAESGHGQDLFVTAVDPAGAALVYSTYLGGSDSDYGSGIALDGAGYAYITGYSLSSNFPRNNALQPGLGGEGDAIIAKILPSQPQTSADLTVTVVAGPDPVVPGTNLTYMVAVTNLGPDAAVGVMLTDAIPAGTTFVSFTAPAGWTVAAPPAGGAGTVTATAASLTGGSGASFTLVVRLDPATPEGVQLSNTATVAATTPDPQTGNNSASASTTARSPLRADLAVRLDGRPIR